MIRLSKSCLSQLEKDAVLSVLDAEYLGMGSEVQKFENALSAYFGREAVCVNTGTAALQLAVQGAGIGFGDEVLVQSLTFVACFQAIRATGALPVACDVTSESMTIDLVDAERRITAKTKAIMPIHYSGGVGPLEEIYAFARRHNLRVIEDASHAFGTKYAGRLVGGFGDISCFSFDGIKNITSGEGGAIVTSDPTVLATIKDARLLGVEKDTEKRFSGSRSWEFDVTAQGWRYHMSNVMAAIGNAQLARFPTLLQKRQALARRYQELLGSESALKLLSLNYDDVVPHIFVVRLLRADRSKVQAFLQEHGIQTGFHYLPNHTLSYFRTDYTLPVTEEIFPQLLTLPLHPDLTLENVEFICAKLIESIR